MNVQLFHASFLKYLLERRFCNEEHANEVLRIAEHILPDFLYRHFGEQIESLYDLQDRDKIRDLQGAIRLNPIIKAEDNSLGDISCTDVLVYYRRFLGSPYNPNHEGYIPPTPVPARIIGKPELEKPNQICTETFLVIGPFDESEVKYAENYIKSKFFRFMVGARKNKNMTKDTYKFAPIICHS